MCGCGAKRGQQLTHSVKMPDGSVKVYSSIEAANAKVKATPGAYLMAPVGVSV
ncbi:hypothetical protein SEA_FRANSOYER_26 [Microbacterium phage Fransoyer]|nr:hypothetical protein SEA_RUBYRALPH_26 [Microbacterium phage RubyRalph]UUG69591.1 hypothetical protein SEA_FRANSOYER_26 [Microbacterium phage Fransoyer]